MWEAGEIGRNLRSNALCFAIKKKRLKGGNQKGGWNRECKVREEGAFDITQERTGESDESNRPRMTN